MAGNGSVHPPYVLSIDVGSSSVRATLYDARGNAVPGTAVTTRHITPATAEGGAADDPVALAEVVEATVDAALERAGGAASEIVGVGLDTYVGNLLGLDADGAPTTPVYTYADTRSRQQVARMRRDLDPVEVHQRTGVTLHTAYAPARLLWLRETEPSAWEATARWIDFATYLYERWFGRRAACSTSAASWSGLLNRHSGRWDGELLDYTSVDPGQLPALAEYRDAMRGLAEGYSARWPALRDVPFCLAVGDGAAANAGEGCASPGAVALTIGTTGAVRAGVPAPLEAVPRGLSVYNLARDRILLGGAVTDAGSLFAWFSDRLCIPDQSALDEEISALAPDGHGLTVLPFLRGERSPGWLDNATGAVVGIRASTTPAEIVHAGLEAVAYRFALIAERLWSVVDVSTDIVVGGGAAQSSPAWMQILADVLGRPLVESADPEATSRGSALLALETAGVIGSIDDLPARHGRRYTPNPGHTAKYRDALDRHHTLYHSLLDPVDERGICAGECVHIT